MAISLKHLFTSAKGDGPDATQVQPSNWNAEHVLTLATGRLLGRTTAGTGAAEEISAGNGLTLSAGTLAASTFNRVVNGCFRVDQRNAGASQTITAGAALAYTVDQWYAYCTGANVTGQRIALSNAQSRYRFTGAASVTGVGFGQRIEATNSLDLAGDNATLQVKASSSSLTSLGWAVYYANSTDAFGTLASPTRTSISSGTFTISSTEAVYTATIAVPSGATTGLEIVFTGGALLASQTLTIGDVQLERGSVATTYQRRLLANELDLCEAYYEKSYNLATTPGTNTGLDLSIEDFYTGNGFPSRVRFARRKSRTPTVVVYDGAGNASRVTVNGTTNNVTPTAVDNFGETGFKIFLSGANTRVSFHWVAEAVIP